MDSARSTIPSIQNIFIIDFHFLLFIGIFPFSHHFLLCTQTTVLVPHPFLFAQISLYSRFEFPFK